MKKKITLSTIKSFIRKNEGALYICAKSRFDGMTDCVQDCGGTFSKAIPATDYLDSTLGIQGAWFVRGSRDYLKPYEDETYMGYYVSNCCGSFIIAIMK